jgi:hypothetical protein
MEFYLLLLAGNGDCIWMYTKVNHSGGIAAAGDGLA